MTRLSRQLGAAVLLATAPIALPYPTDEYGKTMFYATCFADMELGRDGYYPVNGPMGGWQYDKDVEGYAMGDCTFLPTADMFGSFFAPITPTNPMIQVLSQAGLYGYILYIAADLIGDGADLLMLSPKFGPLVGSVLVPILGAVPDGLMVLFSGLDPATAQEQIKVGVGALAGSTVMLLTLPWFLAIIAGRVAIVEEGGKKKCTYSRPAGASDQWDKTGGGFKMFGQGVQVHDSIRQNAKLMIALSFPYYIVQIPAFIVDNKDHTIEEQVAFEKIFAYIALAWTGCGFILYLYLMWRASQDDKSPVKQQVVDQNVKMIEQGHLTLRGAMHDFRGDVKTGAGGLEEGFIEKTPPEEAVRHMCQVLVPFFRKYDVNGDNTISIEEFRMIMNDLGESSIPPEKQKLIFEAADMDSSGAISFEEFVACIMAFAIGMPDKPVDAGTKTQKTAAVYVDQQAKEAGDGDGDDDDDDEEEDMPPELADLAPEEQQRRIKNMAFQKLFVGSVLVLIFSDPMCDLLDVIGKKINVPSFYVGFLIAPLASNASELMASMKQAQKKTVSSIKQALSTLEGAACMNNTFCLFFFFLLIIVQGIAWQFSAETISIVSVQFIIGILCLVWEIQTVFHGFVILALYPGAMVIVWILENIFHLD